MPDIAALVDRVQRVAVRGPRVSWVLEVTGTLECPRVGEAWQPRGQSVVAWLQDWVPGRDACAVVVVVPSCTPSGRELWTVAGCDREGRCAEAVVDAGRVSLDCSRSLAFGHWLRGVWPAPDVWNRELESLVREQW